MKSLTKATVIIALITLIGMFAIHEEDSDGYDSIEQSNDTPGEIYKAGLHFYIYDDTNEDTINLLVNDTTIKVEYRLYNLYYANTGDDPDGRFIVGYDATKSYDETFDVLDADAEHSSPIDSRPYVHQCRSGHKLVDHWVYLDLEQIQKDTGIKNFKVYAKANIKTSMIKTHINYGEMLKEDTVEYPQNTHQFWFYGIEGYVIPEHITITSNGITMVEGSDYRFTKETMDGPLIWLWGGAEGHDLDIYATFSKIYHQLYFDTNGGSTVMDPVTIGENDEYTLPDYNGTKKGYTFTGWRIDGITYQAGSKIVMGTGNMTAIAVWKQTEHLLKFNVLGGSVPLKDWSIPEGMVFTLPDYEGEREGYSFGGWTINGITYKPGSECSMGTADIEAIAIWNENILGQPLVLALIGVIGIFVIVIAAILIRRKI